MRPNSRVLTIAVLSLFMVSFGCKASAAHFGYRDLDVGLQGEDVEELQWMLERMGYYSGVVDGIYGEQTKEAVNKLQELHALPVTGRLDGRMLEICYTLWSAFVTTEFELLEINPEHLNEVGEPQLYIHNVVAGDCLSSIANAYGTRTGLLAQVNRLIDPDIIIPGQKIYVLVYK